MAKVRKKHNPNKRAQMFFSNCVIWTWEADRDAKTGNQYATAKAKTARGWELLEPRIVNALVRYRNNWIITVRAFCRNSSGEEWVEEESRIVRDVALAEFTDLYHQLRAEVLSAQQTAQVVDVGWIAGTYGKQANDERLSLWGLGGYTPERQETWREVNADYLNERAAA